MTYTINIATKLARKAPNKTFRLGAVLVKSGRVLAQGYNIMNSIKSVHAEEMALNRVNNSKGANVSVVRLRKDGSFAMAKPCDSCMAKLIAAGIKKITFTREDGSVETLRL